MGFVFLAIANIACILDSTTQMAVALTGFELTCNNKINRVKFLKHDRVIQLHEMDLCMHPRNAAQLFYARERELCLSQSAHEMASAEHVSHC